MNNQGMKKLDIFLDTPTQFRHKGLLLVLLVIFFGILWGKEVSAVGTDYKVEEVAAQSREKYLQSFHVERIEEQAVKRDALDSFDVSRDGKIIAVTFSGNKIGIYDEWGNWLRGIKVEYSGGIDCELDDEDDKLLILFHRSNLMYKVNKDFSVEDIVYFSIDSDGSVNPSAELYADKERGKRTYKMTNARLVMEENGNEIVLINHSLWGNSIIVWALLLLAVSLCLTAAKKMIGRVPASENKTEAGQAAYVDPAKREKNASERIYIREEKVDYRKVVLTMVLGAPPIAVYYAIIGNSVFPFIVYLLICYSHYARISGSVRQRNALIRSGDMIWCEVDSFTVDKEQLKIMMHVRCTAEDRKMSQWYSCEVCSALNWKKEQIIQSYEAMRYVPIFVDSADPLKCAVADERRQYTEAEYLKLEDKSGIIRSYERGGKDGDHRNYAGDGSARI